MKNGSHRQSGFHFSQIPVRIPVIDLFAGPGGLGEGFSASCDRDGAPRFRVALSIEKEAHAHRTLELRAFFREFERGRVPPEYYSYLRGEISREELFRAFPREGRSASSVAWHAELGFFPFMGSWYILSPYLEARGILESNLIASLIRARIRRGMKRPLDWQQMGGP